MDAVWKDHFDAGMRCGAASDFARAEAGFREAIRLAPDEPYPHYELGYTLSLMGRHDEALPELRRANELVRGFFLVQQEIFMCEQVVSGRLTQQGLELLRQLQRLTEINWRSAQAAQMARQAVEIAPHCAMAHYFLGKTLFDADQPAAEKAFLQCLKLQPDETTAIYAKFHVGSLRRQAGLIAEARSIWQDAVNAHHGNLHIQFCEFGLKSLK